MNEKARADLIRAPGTATADRDADAERGRVLVEESREIVVVLDDQERVVAASRRAREALDGIEEGLPLPPGLLAREPGVTLAVPFEVSGRREKLLYLSGPGDLAAYEELRAGFTAAVSHELRTPLARLLALLESMELPGVSQTELVDEARGEVEQIGELINDILFLSELETGREVVSLGATRLLPVWHEVAAKLSERAVRADVRLEAGVDPALELPLRPRMLRVVLENLAENAIRYAGPGTVFRLTAERDEGSIVVRATDDGAGVSDTDLARLFERFFRTDRARASRGTGLGLAIVKHVVVAAGGSVQASRSQGGGLEIVCSFPHVQSPPRRT